MKENFHYILKIKIHNFVRDCYGVVQDFPDYEKYGMSSQLRRASISVMLNYTEGYARRKERVKLYFYEIAYGSVQECKYLLFFALEQKWLDKKRYRILIDLSEELSKMFWSMIYNIDKKIE
jgi:four helix bundle protein